MRRREMNKGSSQKLSYKKSQSSNVDTLTLNHWVFVWRLRSVAFLRLGQVLETRVRWGFKWSHLWGRGRRQSLGNKPGQTSLSSTTTPWAFLPLNFSRPSCSPLTSSERSLVVCDGESAFLQRTPHSAGRWVSLTAIQHCWSPLCKLKMAPIV